MTEPAWVITCDPGVDDAIALAVAAGRRDCRLGALVAGAGNVPAERAWRNAAGLAALFGLPADLPVAIGDGDRLDGAPIARVGSAHGADGLAGLADRLPAVAGPPVDGRRLVRGNLVALGPLADVARAVVADQPVRRVVWMGGSTSWAASTAPAGVGGSGGSAPGATSRDRADRRPGTEFNAAADPAAVDVVLRSVPDVAIVPLEVTHQVALTRPDLARWAAGSPAARFCADLAATRNPSGDGGRDHATDRAQGADRDPGRDHDRDPGGDRGRERGDRAPGADPLVDHCVRGHGVVLHDPVAVIAALEPGLFRWARLPRPHDRSTGRPAGLEVPAPGRRPLGPRIAVGIDADAVRRRIIAAVEAV